jgi:hypothetical protein
MIDDVALKKNHRFGGQFHPTFSGVIGVVEADTDEFSNAAYTRSKAWITFHQRQTGRIKGTQFRKAYIIKCGTGDIINDTR